VIPAQEPADGTGQESRTVAPSAHQPALRRRPGGWRLSIATCTFCVAGHSRSLDDGRGERWPTRFQTWQLLMSTWIMSPGRSQLVSGRQTFGVKFFRRPRPGPFMSRPTVEQGAQEEPWRLRAERAAWCRQGLQACWSCCGSSVRRLLRRTVRDSARVPLRRLRRNLGEQLVAVRRLDPGLCVTRALEWQPSSKCRLDEPFPTDGLSVGPEVAYAWLCEVFGPGGDTRTPWHLTPPCQSDNVVGLHS